MFCADLRKDSVSRCREIVLWKQKVASGGRGERNQKSKKGRPTLPEAIKIQFWSHFDLLRATKTVVRTSIYAFERLRGKPKKEMKKKTNDLPRVGSEIQDIVPLRRARSCRCANFSPCHVTSQTKHSWADVVCVSVLRKSDNADRQSPLPDAEKRRGNIQKRWACAASEAP